MEYTAEDYINFIEIGRIDKISTVALNVIAKRFRELECNEFKGPGDGDYSFGEYGEEKFLSLILKNPGQSKLLVVKTMREQLGIGLREAKELMDQWPVKIFTTELESGELFIDKDIRDLKMKMIKEIKLKLEECGAELEIR